MEGNGGGLDWIGLDWIGVSLFSGRPSIGEANQRSQRPSTICMQGSTLMCFNKKTKAWQRAFGA